MLFDVLSAFQKQAFPVLGAGGINSYWHIKVHMLVYICHVRNASPTVRLTQTSPPALIHDVIQASQGLAAKAFATEGSQSFKICPAGKNFAVYICNSIFYLHSIEAPFTSTAAVPVLA